MAAAEDTVSGGGVLRVAIFGAGRGFPSQGVDSTVRITLLGPTPLSATQPTTSAGGGTKTKPRRTDSRALVDWRNTLEPNKNRPKPNILHQFKSGKSVLAQDAATAFQTLKERRSTARPHGGAAKGHKTGGGGTLMRRNITGLHTKKKLQQATLQRQQLNARSTSRKTGVVATSSPEVKAATSHVSRATSLPHAPNRDPTLAASPLEGAVATATAHTNHPSTHTAAAATADPTDEETVAWRGEGINFVLTKQDAEAMVCMRLSLEKGNRYLGEVVIDAKQLRHTANVAKAVSAVAPQWHVLKCNKHCHGKPNKKERQVSKDMAAAAAASSVTSSTTSLNSDEARAATAAADDDGAVDDTAAAAGSQQLAAPGVARGGNLAAVEEGDSPAQLAANAAALALGMKAASYNVHGEIHFAVSYEPAGLHNFEVLRLLPNRSHAALMAGIRCAVIRASNDSLLDDLDEEARASAGTVPAPLDLNATENTDISVFYRSIMEEKFSVKVDGPGSIPFTFEFREHGRLAFKAIRRICNIDEVSYLRSLTELPVVPFGATGKSGCAFYQTWDHMLFLKSLRSDEGDVLARILPSYVQHVQRFPQTLLPRFYGHFTLQGIGAGGPGGVKASQGVGAPAATGSEGAAVSYVVMKNVFDSPLPVHVRYDLKGSTQGRSVSEKERQQYLEHKRSDAVMKDLDLNANETVLTLAPSHRVQLLKQIREDVRLLEAFDLMDYSLLLGIHHKLHHRDGSTGVSGGDKKKERQNTGFFKKLFGGRGGSRRPTGDTTASAAGDASKRTNSKVDGGVGALPENEEVNDDDRTQTMTTGGDNGATTSAATDSEAAVDAEAESKKDSDAAAAGPNKGEKTNIETSLAPSADFYHDRSESTLAASPRFKTLDEQSWQNRVGTRRVRSGRGKAFSVTDFSYVAVNGDKLFIGIIDMLQEYNTMKKMENVFKSAVLGGSSKISCIPAKAYSKRFRAFLEQVVVESSPGKPFRRTITPATRGGVSSSADKDRA